MRCSDSSCNSLHNAIASPRCVLGARYAGVADRVGNALEDSRPLENTIFTSKAISKMSVKPDTETNLTANQQTLNDLWEEHVRDEFTTRDTEATLRTMVPDAYVNHVPVMTGGVGHSALREFYSRRFIPQMPPDTEMIPVSRTIGTDQLVDEMIFRFTHTMEMDCYCRGYRRRASGSKFHWWRLFTSAKGSWRTNISTGIKLPCWCNSGFLALTDCRSREWRSHAKF
jgi:hypothetical protein